MRLIDLSYGLRQSGELHPPPIDPVHDPEGFKNRLKQSIDQCHTGYSHGHKIDNQTALVIPTVQFGPAGVHHDEEATAVVLEAPGPGTRLSVTTGYFNCTSRYEAALVGTAACEVWVAAPSANGLSGARGAEALIAPAYSLIEEQFFHRVSQKEQRVELREYARSGWTYHAKRLWLQPDQDDDPVATLVGSPTFGERSVHRDLEVSVIVLTANKALRRRLALEREMIRAHTSVVTTETFHRARRSGDAHFDKPSSRMIRGNLLRMITNLCKGYL